MSVRGIEGLNVCVFSFVRLSSGVIQRQHCLQSQGAHNHQLKSYRFTPALLKKLHGSRTGEVGVIVHPARGHTKQGRVFGWIFRCTGHQPVTNLFDVLSSLCINVWHEKHDKRVMCYRTYRSRSATRLTCIFSICSK